jgi:hypothetical protein
VTAVPGVYSLMTGVNILTILEDFHYLFSFFCSRRTLSSFEHLVLFSYGGEREKRL